jgi:GrpB-like predicted nucleotidyltransferase (UPF0157 family)
MMKSTTLVIEPYNPQWEAEFERLRTLYLQHLGEFSVDIQHVGSTAITGLCAKPILDIDIIIEDKSLLGGITARLEALGYIAKGEQGIPGRFAFRQANNTVPFQKPHHTLFPHHLYLCFSDSLALKNHLLFRDMLRSNVEIREEYSALKQALVGDLGMNPEQYLRGKTEFILSALSLAGLTQSEIQVIREANIEAAQSLKISFFSRQHWKMVWSFMCRK